MSRSIASARVIGLICLLVASASSGIASGAAIIQVDMGTSAGVYAGNSSPGHALSLVSVGETTWNGIAPAAGAQNLPLYADGSAASGISLTLGAAFNGAGNAGAWTFGNFVAQFSNNVPSGFYDTSLVEDILYNGNGMGARIAGLPAGNYEVIAISLHTFATSRSWTIGVGVNPGTAQFGDAVTIGSDNANGAWVAAPGTNSNYYRKQVTLGAGDTLGVIVTTISDSPSLAGLQIIQIIPEPGGMSMIAATMAVGTLSRRRRK